MSASAVVFAYHDVGVRCLSVLLAHDVRIPLVVYVVVIAKRVVLGEATGIDVIWDRDILEFFLIGVQLFGLGLIGEYVGRIYQQVRERPRYTVQAVLERIDHGPQE